MKILTLIVLFLISANTVRAITPTPEASSSGSASLDEIQKIREVVQQKVKEKLQQITTVDNSIPRSAIGTITQINNKEITISYKNSNQLISVTDETIFIDAKKNKISLDKLKSGQDILALGYINDGNNLEAKRIVIIDLKTIENINQVVTGKIVDLSKTSPIFTLIPSKNKNTQFQIEIDDKTEIIDSNNKKYTQKNLISGQKVIVIIKPDPKIQKTYYASKIIINDPQTLTPTLTLTPTPKK
jgi:hypothetical protein